MPFIGRALHCRLVATSTRMVYIFLSNRDRLPFRFGCLLALVRFFCFHYVPIKHRRYCFLCSLLLLVQCSSAPCILINLLVFICTHYSMMISSGREWHALSTFFVLLFCVLVRYTSSSSSSPFTSSTNQKLFNVHGGVVHTFLLSSIVCIEYRVVSGIWCFLFFVFIFLSCSCIASYRFKCVMDSVPYFLFASLQTIVRNSYAFDGWINKVVGDDFTQTHRNRWKIEHDSHAHLCTVGRFAQDNNPNVCVCVVCERARRQTSFPHQSNVPTTHKSFGGRN